MINQVYHLFNVYSIRMCSENSDTNATVDLEFNHFPLRHHNLVHGDRFRIHQVV